MAQQQVVLALLLVSQVLGGFTGGVSHLTKPYFPHYPTSHVGNWDWEQDIETDLTSNENLKVNNLHHHKNINQGKVHQPIWQENLGGQFNTQEKTFDNDFTKVVVVTSIGEWKPIEVLTVDDLFIVWNLIVDQIKLKGTTPTYINYKHY